MTQQKEYLLFLDDIRNPQEAFLYTHIPLYTRTWVVVRNYDEFVATITAQGLPELISFDHDLADSHYTPEHLWTDYAKSKDWQDAQVHEEKTGYDCAKWLVEYCMDNDMYCPAYLCHSMNPVGKNNIMGLLNFFKKYPQQNKK